MKEKQVRGCIGADCLADVDKQKYVMDSEYNVYVLPGYGAWMGNVETKEQLNKYLEYRWYGYELIIGPSSNHYAGYGVYCKNYRELYQSKLDYIDRIMKGNTAPSAKKLLIGMWLKQKYITTSPALDWRLREVLGVMMENTPLFEDFSADSLNEVEKVLFGRHK